MSIPRPPLLHKGEWRAKRCQEAEISILPRPPEPCDEAGGVKEKPPKTTSSMQRDHPSHYGHGQLTWGTTYLAAKTIR